MKTYGVTHFETKINVGKRRTKEFLSQVWQELGLGFCGKRPENSKEYRVSIGEKKLEGFGDEIKEKS